ncbi:MAG: cellulose biosynthesis cyclic di-GMP-binding regulatory protein BcsB, partial [Nevskiales bacterium]
MELARRGLRRQAATAAAVLLSLSAGLTFAPRAHAADAVPAVPAVAEFKPTDQAYADAGHSLKLEDLGQRYPLRLQTVFGQASIPVSVRRDQVVTKARLHVLYSHSPSLIPNLS